MVANAAWQIPNTRLDDLKARAARLARRAAKCGTEPFVFNEVHNGVRRQGAYEMPCTWVEVTGPAPRINGYRFVARIEHTEAGNLVSRPDASDDTDLAAWRTASPRCDHCNTERRRIDTFVLRTPEGALKQIGRNCLADFLRSGDVETVLAVAAFLEELAAVASDDGGDGDTGYASGWRLVYPVAQFLACAVSAERHYGWKSSKEDGATKELALFLAGMRPTTRSAAEEWDRCQPTDADRERAGAILAWVTTSTDTSDYMHNLRVATARDNIDPARTAGLVASAVVAYAREVERALRDRAERKESTYFGEVGKRYDVEGVVSFVRHIESQWGVTTLVSFVDADGHVFKWFASGDKEFKTGTKVAMKGTVKKHEEYKGEKGTVLTRCKVKEVA